MPTGAFNFRVRRTARCTRAGGDHVPAQRRDRTRRVAAGAKKAYARPRATAHRAIAQSRGCLACHSLDGAPGVGPTWKGLFGATRTLVGGVQVKADEAYLRRSIVQPGAEVVQGFAPVMPTVELGEQEIDAVVAFIRDIAAAAPAQP